VVGGFVKYQHVGLLQHELAKENTRRLAAGRTSFSSRLSSLQKASGEQDHRSLIEKKT